MTHFADRTLAAIAAKGAPSCVGIDPVFSRLPHEIKQQVGIDPQATDAPAEAAAEAFLSFGVEVLDAVAPYTPMIKYQSACFERYFAEGLEVLHQLIKEAQARNLLVILDAKRGDIGSSAAHYAAGCLASSPELNTEGYAYGEGPDALTVNAYFGLDGIEPFLKTCAAEGKGLFALVRTSNPGGDAIQSQVLQDGRTVAQAMGAMVTDLGKDLVGESGYSALGAVVGATKTEDAITLREIMGQQLFLIPGYGAQGGGVEDVKPNFKSDGTGGIVTASRSITFAYKDAGDSGWRQCIGDAAKLMHEDLKVLL